MRQAGIHGTCKHSAALLLFVSKESSARQTDVEQAWGRVSNKMQDLYPKGGTAEEIFNLPALSLHQQMQLTRNRQDLAKFGMNSSSLHKSLVIEKETCSSEIVTCEPPVVPSDVRSFFMKEFLGLIPSANHNQRQMN